MTGYIALHCYNLYRGPWADVQKVLEPAGFEGERITPTPQSPLDKKHWFTIPRGNRVVYATRKEAQQEARKLRGSAQS